MRTPRLSAVLLPVLAVVLVSACASQPDAPAAAPSPARTASATPTPTPTPTPTGARMSISGFAYVVPPSVRPGEQVTVVNEDREAHTVTVDGGAVRLAVPPGSTAVFTAPSGVGDHQVVCDLHGGMEAVLVVA